MSGASDGGVGCCVDTGGSSSAGKSVPESAAVNGTAAVSVGRGPGEVDRRGGEGGWNTGRRASRPNGEASKKIWTSVYTCRDYTSTTTVGHNATHDPVPLRICIRWIKFKGGVHCVSKGVPRRMISFRNGER